MREYLALGWGAPERRSGTIEAALGRHQTQREKMAVVHGDRGKEAVTHWRLVESYGDRNGKPVAALIACRLETGRTHQIRVHMAHIGCPLIADPVYATGFKTKEKLLPPAAREAASALGRQALHAAGLACPHPISGDDLDVESPAPADFENLRKALARL